MYAGSVGLQLMLINFKPIAAGGMVGASGSIKCQQFIGGAIPPVKLHTQALYLCSQN